MSPDEQIQAARRAARADPEAPDLDHLAALAELRRDMEMLREREMLRALGVYTFIVAFPQRTQRTL